MKICSLEEFQPGLPTVVSVGNFDGVHLGHAALLDEVCGRALARGLQSIIITFNPNTRSLLNRNDYQGILTTFEEKAHLIRQYKINTLIWIPFNDTFKSMTARQFVYEILIDRLHADEFVMGIDHNFGKERSGNRNSLRSFVGKNDIKTFSVSLQSLDSRFISSTEIRTLVRKGDIAGAVKMLGHPYLIETRRISGKKMGARLGFPTLNFQTPAEEKVLPPPGVYAAQIEYDEIRVNGALYFGNCPTFGNRATHFEFHVLDGRVSAVEGATEVFLWIHTHIRGDMVFDTGEALSRQIKSDIKEISSYFEQLPR